jgi:outer membrane protein TolC
MSLLKLKNKNIISFLLCVAICACSVETRPLTDWERAVRVDRDIRGMFGSRPLVVKENISLYDAFAFALKNNLDRKLKIMEEALLHAQTGSATLEMLPNIMASAGYEVRTEDSAYLSKNMTTGVKSADFLSYGENQHASGGLSFSWNLLDFGVSYFNAQQFANRALIKKEQRRKVIHQLLKEVRHAYWKAYSAQKLLPEIDDMMEKALVAIEEAKDVENNILKSKDKALNFQMSVMETVQDIRVLRKELFDAEVKLSTLMGLKPGTQYTLVGPQEGDFELANINAPLDKIEWLALMNRAELRQEDYQLMIDRYETRKQVYSLIPGLDLIAARKFDTNPFLYTESWGEMAAKVTFNLLNPAKMTRRYEAGALRENVDDLRRQALTMAVLTQVHVAWGRYNQAMDDYQLQEELAEVAEKIAEKTANEADLELVARAEQIRVSTKALLLRIKRDLAYADYQDSIGSIYATIGLDAVPENVMNRKETVISEVLKKAMKAWDLGRFTPEDTPMMVPVPNKKPAVVVTSVLPDKVVLEGETFIYQVPQNVFAEAQLGADVVYNAKLTDGSALPNWIYFNKDKRLFSGQAPANHHKIVEIAVFANDSMGHLAKATFNLDIKRGYMATVDIHGADGEKNVTVIEKCRGKNCVSYKHRFDSKDVGKNVEIAPIEGRGSF